MLRSFLRLTCLSISLSARPDGRPAGGSACKPWCSAHTGTWKVKCSFSQCNACSECSSDALNAGPALPSSDAVNSGPALPSSEAVNAGPALPARRAPSASVLQSLHPKRPGPLGSPKPKRVSPQASGAAAQAVTGVEEHRKPLAGLVKGARASFSPKAGLEGLAWTVFVLLVWSDLGTGGPTVSHSRILCD